MLRAAQSILGCGDLAWDAVQETLLRVWGKGWLPGEPLGALVHLTARSSLHQLRCQRRRSFHEAKVGEEYEACCAEDPLAALENTELAQNVRRALRSLTDEYRVVLELYEFGGESYDAIAERLGLPVGTVRSRLSRGRALLRDRLQADFEAA